MKKTLLGLTGLAALTSITGCPPKAAPQAKTVTVTQNQEDTQMQNAEAKPAAIQIQDHDYWVKTIMGDQIRKTPASFEGVIEAVNQVETSYTLKGTVKDTNESREYSANFTFNVLSVKGNNTRLRLAYVWSTCFAPKEEVKITYFSLKDPNVRAEKFAAIALSEHFEQSTFTYHLDDPYVTIDGIIGNYKHIEGR